MIENSNEISTRVKDLVVQLGDQSKVCTDPRLREQLETAAQTVNTFTVQLKILTSVKAATEDVKSQKHFKIQLGKAAKSLSSAIIKTVHASEVAALKTKN